MKPNLILWNSFFCTVVLESVVALIVLPCCSCCCRWCWCRCSCIWCCCGECIFSCKRFPRFLMLGELNKRSTQFNTFLKFEMFRNFVRPLAFRFSFYHRCISTIHYSFEASPLWNDSLRSFSGLKKIRAAEPHPLLVLRLPVGPFFAPCIYSIIHNADITHNGKVKCTRWTASSLRSPARLKERRRSMRSGLRDKVVKSVSRWQQKNLFLLVLWNFTWFVLMTPVLWIRNELFRIHLRLFRVYSV